MEFNLSNWEALAYERQLKSLGVEGVRLADLLMKADDPVLQATTGVYTTLYGARVHDNLYRMSTFWQITPKVNFMDAKSGVRLKTADPANLSGITETGALAETDKPDVIQYAMTIKRVNSTWDISEFAQAKSLAEDGKAGGEAAWMMDSMAEYFVSALNAKLITHNGTLAGNFPESYDRGIAHDQEIDVSATDADGAAYTAGDLDYLGLDRDTTATYNAQVSYAAADRPLTTSLIDTMMLDAEKNGAKRNRMVIVSGFDTIGDWAQLLSSQQRFEDYKEVTVGANGVSVSGRETGFRVAVKDGVPILPDKNTPIDTGGASRMYGVDQDSVEFRMMSPTRHLSSPVENAILHDSFVERHSLDLAGELVFKKFASNWKIRDLA